MSSLEEWWFKHMSIKDDANTIGTGAPTVSGIYSNNTNAAAGFPPGSILSYGTIVEHQRILQEIQQKNQAIRAEADYDHKLWHDFFVTAETWPSHLTERTHILQAALAGRPGPQEILERFAAYKAFKRMTK